jgi:hypothetical protein
MAFAEDAGRHGEQLADDGLRRVRAALDDRGHLGDRDAAETQRRLAHDERVRGDG